MVSTAYVLRMAGRRFLPAVAGALAAAAVLVTGLSSRHGLAALAEVRWQVAAGEALAMSAGYAAALLAVRRRLRPWELRSWPRTVHAALLAVGALFVLSMFGQPLGLGRLALLNVGAGVAAATVVPGVRVLRRRRAAI